MNRGSRELYAMRPDLYDVMHADFVEDMRFMQEFGSMLDQSPRVLELGCGTGRLLLPLLDAGAVVVGLDREPAMLSLARDRLGLYGERIELVEGDMREFSLPRQFDLVVVGLNTFMHMLTIKDQIATLECAHRHLRPAGLLLLDLANPHSVVRDTPMGVVQHRFTKSLPGAPAATVSLCSITEISPAEQLTHTTLFFDELRDETGLLQRSIAEVTLRLTYRYELEHLLHRAGFSVKNLFGDYDSGPFDDDSERLICVASALA